MSENEVDVDIFGIESEAYFKNDQFDAAEPTPSSSSRPVKKLRKLVKSKKSDLIPVVASSTATAAAPRDSLSEVAYYPDSDEEANEPIAKPSALPVSYNSKLAELSA